VLEEAEQTLTFIYFIYLHYSGTVVRTMPQWANSLPAEVSTHEYMNMLLLQIIKKNDIYT
jgi:hypothetical protein